MTLNHIQYTQLKVELLYIINLTIIQCVVEGVQVKVECSQSEFVVGKTVNCSCSSNKEYKWYRGNSTIPLNTDISEDGAQLNIPVTTDIEGEMYTCSVSISCWKWKDTITVSVIGIHIVP